MVGAARRRLRAEAAERRRAERRRDRHHEEHHRELPEREARPTSPSERRSSLASLRMTRAMPVKPTELSRARHLNEFALMP